jgi:signal transduction histidine kinase
MSVRRALQLAIVVSLAGFVGGWAATPLPHQLRLAAIDVGWFLLAALAGAAAWHAAGQPSNRHLRTSLRCLAAGALVWSAGQVIWTYQELVQNLDSPVFELADVGYWLALPLLAAGVFAWPREPIERRLGTVLDFALILGFALLFGVEFMLQPLLEHELDALGLTYAILYPPGEVLLFGAVIAALLLDHWRDRRRLELVAVGLLIVVIGDAAYTYLGDAYATGGWLDPLWAMGFAIVGLAATSDPGQERHGRISQRALAVAPSAALSVIALIGIGAALSGRTPLGAGERAAIFALVVLLALRQAYTQLRLLEQMAEQRRLEQQLVHAQKLEAVGRLAGGVAHDFNNLLTAIDGYSALAHQGLAPGHPVRGDIEEVRRAAQRAAELTRQLLAFSRRQVLAPQVVDLNTVVADAERLLRSLTGESVALETVLAPRPALVRADPGQLEQVITNLVVNARDAMPDGGTVTIATSARGGCVRLSVSDTGAGMSDAIRGRIFEPFFTTKEVGKGTGLGLAMVHGILAQSNGEIAVTSAPGQGTTFTIELPAADMPADQPAQATDAPPVSGSERVLLVEDEPAVRDLARRMLERAGYDVCSAASGEEALELLHCGRPVDVLVTDIVMPGMSGHELAGKLRGSCPRLAVVLMSGYSQDAEALDRLRAAGAAFVEKPFTSSALVSEVRGVLDAAAVPV